MTEAQWLACSAPYFMLEHLRDSGVVGRKLYLFACACARAIWPLLTDRRSRAAVEAAEAFADGRLSPDDLARARKLSHRARMKTPTDFRTPAGAAHHLLIPDQHGGMGVAMNVALVARDAEDGYRGSHGRYFISDDPNYAPDHPVQAHLLHDIFGNPFRPVAIDPAWRTRTVEDLARAAYEERLLPSGHLEPARLGVLADALEEAGCTEPGLLDHLRSPEVHVRGCFAVDVLLNRA